MDAEFVTAAFQSLPPGNTASGPPVRAAKLPRHDRSLEARGGSRRAERDRDHAAPDPGQQHDGARVRQGSRRSLSVRQSRVRAARRAAAARDPRPDDHRHRPARGRGAAARERPARDRDRVRARDRGGERHPRPAAHHAREQVPAARPRRPALRRVRHLDRHHRAQAIAAALHQAAVALSIAGGERVFDALARAVAESSASTR